MALEVPEGRKVHIARIFGTNKDGEILSDMYADVLRIDQMRSRTQREYNRIHRLPLWQTVTLRPRHWNDKEGYDGTEEEEELVETENRDFELLKLVPPDEDNPDDPEEWIPLRIPKRIKMNDSGFDNSRRFLILKEDADKPDAREVQAIRIHFYETNIDKDAEAAAEAGNKVFYVGPDDVLTYEKDPDTEDKETYIQYEIITRFRTRKGRSNADSDGSDQGLHFNLKNKFLIDDADGEAEDDKVYRPDPMQNIINISWGGDAVEFEEGEYIAFDHVPVNTKQFLTSFWFRAPSSVLALAKEEWDAYWQGGDVTNPDLFSVMLGIVPLCVFGANPKFKVSETVPTLVGTAPSVTKWRWEETCSESEPHCVSSEGWVVYEPESPGADIYSNMLQFTGETREGEQAAMEPCLIGIDCRGDYPTLCVIVNAIGTVLPTVSNHNAFSYSGPDHIDQYGYLGDSFCCGGPTHYLKELPGGGFILCLTPLQDSYTIAGGAGGNSDAIEAQASPPIYSTRAPFDGIFSGNSRPENLYTGKQIEADHWHHAIVSFDGRNGAATKGRILPDGDSGTNPHPTVGSRTTRASKLFISLDDQNLTKRNLSGMHPQGYADGNAVLPVNGYRIAITDTQGAVSIEDDCLGNMVTTTYTPALPTFSLPAGDIPVGDGQFGIPVNAFWAEKGKRVQMAFFQWFNDVSANPADIEVRRCFITDNGTPAQMRKAEEYFEKKPEIRLKKLNDWKNARNTGSLTEDDPSEVGIVVGEIEKYKPKPSLYGPQGETS